MNSTVSIQNVVCLIGGAGCPQCAQTVVTEAILDWLTETEEGLCRREARTTGTATSFLSPNTPGDTKTIEGEPFK